MSVIIHPSDDTVLPNDTVYDIVHIIVGMVGDLFVDGVLYRIEILRMNHAAESIACKSTEFFDGLAAEDHARGLVDIQNLLGLVGTVDEKAAGHLLCQPLDGRQLLFLGKLLGKFMVDGELRHGNVSPKLQR